MIEIQLFCFIRHWELIYITRVCNILSYSKPQSYHWKKKKHLQHTGYKTRIKYLDFSNLENKFDHENKFFKYFTIS